MCLIDLESLVDAKRPVRQLKRMCLEPWHEMDADYDEMYASDAR